MAIQLWLLRLKRKQNLMPMFHLDSSDEEAVNDTDEEYEPKENLYQKKHIYSVNDDVVFLLIVR